jgi:prevent-host-death family protein
MGVITQRQLRNDSARIMNSVEAGERFTVTRRGRPVAQLAPVLPPAPERGPRTFVPTQELFEAFRNAPVIDYEAMRREADDLFSDGGDRIG